MKRIKAQNGPPPSGRNGGADGTPRFTPFDQQRHFLMDLAPICAAVTGIGGAKTKTGAAKVVLAADAIPGIRILITAPTYHQLEQGTMRSVRELIHPARIARTNKNEHVIELINGSAIYYHSADQFDNLRGPEYGMAWMDEAAYCTEKSYLVMIGRVRQPNTPRQKIITTTPAGKNWVYKLLLDRNVPSVTEPTGEASYVIRYNDGRTIHRWRTHDNIHLPPEYITILEESYGGTDFFNQELLGEFVSFRGLVYYLPDQAYVDYLPNGPFVRAFGGIDFGSTNAYAHATAAVVCVEDRAGRIWVVDEFYRRQASAEELAEWLITQQGKWNVQRWTADRSQFTGLQLLRSGGLHLAQSPPPSESSVLDGISIIQRRLGSGGLFLCTDRVPNLISEFGSYQWKEPKEGGEARKEPLKIRDDAMDALRYAITSIERQTLSGGRRARKVVFTKTGSDQSVWGSRW